MTHTFRKLLSLFLVLSITLSVCSCSFLTRIRHQISNSISEQELIRLVVEAVDDGNSLSDSFAAIPEAQRVGVSFSHFKEYVDIMRKMSSARGSLDSFRRLNSTDSAIVINDLLAQNDSSLENVTNGGTIVVAELIYSDNSGGDEQTAGITSDYKSYIYFSRNDSGTAYLDHLWITKTIEIYNYIEHYFSMLNEQNTRGVYTLLRPALSNEYFTDDVIYSRAQALEEYYLLKVKSTINVFELLEINPLLVVFLQPAVISDNNLSINSRIVSVHGTQEGVYVIDDIIPQIADTSLITLYRSDISALRVGNTYSSSYVYSMFGNPQLVYIDPTVIETRENSSGQIEEKHEIIITYTGILLKFEAYITGDNVWNGRLSTVRLFSTSQVDYFLSNGLTIGTDIQTLLAQYPFIDEYDYMITYIYEGQSFTASFNIDNGLIGDIRVSDS